MSHKGDKYPSSYRRPSLTESIISGEPGKKPNFIMRLLRRLALPSKSEMKRFNWRTVEAQFDLLDNYDECQKDIYRADSHDMLLETVDCPYRIRNFMEELPEEEVHDPHVIPMEVRSLYSQDTFTGDFQKKNVQEDDHHGVPLEDLSEEQLTQLLEDLFLEIPNEQIAWEKTSSELEDVLDEALRSKWKDIDFTPELPKINLLLRKKMNKQIKIEEKREPDLTEFNFSDDSSLESLEDVDVYSDPYDLHGLSEAALTDDDDANWSDIDDIHEDMAARLEDPEFIADLERMFPEKYRGDCEDDKDFIEVNSDTSSIFQDADDEMFGQVKEELRNLFKNLPEFIEVNNDAQHIFGEHPLFENEGYIEPTSDIDDLFGNDSHDEIEIHSDESSLYDTSSDEDMRASVSSRTTTRQPKSNKSFGTVTSKKKELDTNEIQVMPQLEITDMELKDLIKFRFQKKKAVPMSTAADSLTPLENEIECLVQIAAEIRGYGKHEDDDPDYDINQPPVEENPKVDGPSQTWSDVASDVVKEDEEAKELNKIDAIPSHYSLELNFPATTILHPVVLNGEVQRFKQTRDVEDYTLGSKSLEKVNKMTKRRQVPVHGENKRLKKCRHYFYHKSSLGKAVRKNLRYNHISVHFPKYCRRCKVPLMKSLVPYITPYSMIFCCILPFLSYPCFSANKEYQCIVCQEVYLLGDFKPPLKPIETEKDERQRYREIRDRRNVLRKKYSNPKY